MLSVITSISFDHTQYLGTSLKEIAQEKAGIIKHKIPVVLGPGLDKDTRSVFYRKAEDMEAEYLEAEYNSSITKLERTPSMVYSIHHKDIKNLSLNFVEMLKKKISIPYLLHYRHLNGN